MREQYDVIIVGSGPAGIFAAMELSSHGDLSVLLVEKGNDLQRRRCPIKNHSLSCVYCSPCSLVSGWGGAGAFSDGKLTLSPDVGGHLREYIGLEETNQLIRYVDDVYLRFGAPSKVYGTGDGIEQLKRRATMAELRLIPMPVRHLGTEHCLDVLQAMRAYIDSGVEVALGTAVTKILAENGTVTGIVLESGEHIHCRYLVVAPGREGADWLAEEGRRLKLTLHHNPVDVGVRVEVPASLLDEITNVLYEAKLEYYSRSFDDRVRTFCMCPSGEVTMEFTAGSDPVITVNGHSYADRKTSNTNFAILVSTQFTEPFREPIAYGRYLARLANILSGGVIIQRLGDLLGGHRSTISRIERGVIEPTLKGATPGDLSFVLPYRYLQNILEMIQALDKLAPGVASHHTLLYGVEVKFYSSRLHLSPSLETEITNLYAAGDGAGISRGLVQASASGVVVAREILRREGCPVSQD